MQYNKEGPGLSFSGQGRGSNKLTGKFVIWELEIQNGAITRAAVDFVQNSEGNTNAPLVGVLRFNSSYE